MSVGSDEPGLSQGQVRLCEPTARWSALFEEEARRLNAALGTFGAAVEHCGSTSIPGIPAKPILDILAGIPGSIDVASIKNALAPLGYEHATWAGVPGHEVFGKGDPRTHLIHVVPLHGPAWDRMIGLRDALSEDATLAAKYGQLKRQLAARYPERSFGLHRWQSGLCRARPRSEVMPAARSGHSDTVGRPAPLQGALRALQIRTDPGWLQVAPLGCASRALQKRTISRMVPSGAGEGNLLHFHYRPKTADFCGFSECPMRFVLHLGATSKCARGND